jgi:hypothetical protein
MKKFILIILILCLSILSCKEEQINPSDDYKEMGLEKAKAINDKSYTIGPGCTTSTECPSIIFSGTINSVNYVGIAIDNSHTTTPPDFKILIYWPGTLSGSNESFNLLPTQYNIKIWNSSDYFESLSTQDPPTATTNLNISLTVVDGVAHELTSINTKVYTITFNDTLNVGTYSIAQNNTIVAHKY